MKLGTIIGCIAWALVIIIAILSHYYTDIHGIPVVSESTVNSSYALASANIFSAGVLSAGIFSIGIFSIGIFSIGIFSIGIFNFAIYAGMGLFVRSLMHKKSLKDILKN